MVGLSWVGMGCLLLGRGGPASALTLPADPVEAPPGPITVNVASPLSEEDDVVDAAEEEEEVIVVDEEDVASVVVLVFSFLKALGSSPSCKLVSTFTDALGSG